MIIQLLNALGHCGAKMGGFGVEGSRMVSQRSTHDWRNGTIWM